MDHGVIETVGNKPASNENKIHRRISIAERMNANFESAERKGSKESNTDRLRFILEEPPLRTLFREFLRGNFCEENLSFWLDVQDFKRKFNITSSAMAVAPTGGRPGGKATPGQAAMEKHHESLISTAFVIYNKYLAPSSQNELNIDHGLRNELAKYLDEVVTTLTGKTFHGRVEPEQANAFNATQLQKMIQLYERIQTHVFRLMATDSVPKVNNNLYNHFDSSPLIKPPVHQNTKVLSCPELAAKPRSNRKRRLVHGPICTTGARQPGRIRGCTYDRIAASE